MPDDRSIFKQVNNVLTNARKKGVALSRADAKAYVRAVLALKRAGVDTSTLSVKSMAKIDPRLRLPARTALRVYGLISGRDTSGPQRELERLDALDVRTPPPWKPDPKPFRPWRASPQPWRPTNPSPRQTFTSPATPP